MIRSMTGFGRARAAAGNYDVAIEIKAVNHRYCEMNIRLPRIYSRLEDKVRAVVQRQVGRGKVEVFVNIATLADEEKGLKLNEALLAEYLGILRGAAEKFGFPDDFAASTVLKLPDVLTAGQQDPDIQSVWEAVCPVLEDALLDFVAQREREGAYLAADIGDKCGEILARVDAVKSRSAELESAYLEKLETRIRQLVGDAGIDEQRLLTEAAVMADRMAIDEELVRLYSHTDTLRSLLQNGMAAPGAFPAGKKADFIIQEMNREINTVTSKIGDLEVTGKAIEVKNTIEKIREQIQNIE